MGATFAQLKEFLGVRLRVNLPDGEVMDTELPYGVNEGNKWVCRRVADVEPEWLATTYNVATASGTSEYSLPADTYKVLGVGIKYNAGGLYQEATKYEFKDRWIPVRNQFHASSTSDPIYYLATASTGNAQAVVISPAPTSAIANGLAVRYVKDPANFSDDADVSALPDLYTEAILCAGEIIIRERLGKPAPDLSARLESILPKKEEDRTGRIYTRPYHPFPPEGKEGKTAG